MKLTGHNRGDNIRREDRSDMNSNQISRKKPKEGLPSSPWRPVVLGVLLIFAALAVIYLSEKGNDLTKLVSNSIALKAGTINLEQSLQGKLVSATGKLNSNQLLGDGLFIKPGRNILLERRVEMFSWVEKKRVKAKEEGTFEAEEDNDYTYIKEWTEDPALSASFKHPEGHENPEKRIDNALYKLKEVKLGQYEFDSEMIKFPDLLELELDKYKISTQEGARWASERYIFMGTGNSRTPHIGDLRISYKSLPEGSKVTVLGKLAGNAIVPYLDQKGYSIYQLYYGERKDALRDFRKENQGTRWIAGIFAFLLLWAAFFLLLESKLAAPINKRFNFPSRWLAIVLSILSLLIFRFFCWFGCNIMVIIALPLLFWAWLAWAKKHGPKKVLN